MFVDWTTAGRDALDYALTRAPAHLAPALRAVRDHGCAFVFVAQAPTPFTVRDDRPAIVLIGDDLASAMGPAGFDDASLRAFLPTCGAVAIVSSAPVPSLYWETVAWAVTKREPVAIIETRVEREAEWVDFVGSLVPPRAALGVATVRAQGAA